MTASTQAVAAIRADKNRRQWGEFASLRYAEKRGVPFPMYLVAVRVETARKSKHTS